MSSKSASAESKLDLIKEAKAALVEDALKVIPSSECKADVETHKATQIQNVPSSSRPKTRCATDTGLKPNPVNTQSSRSRPGALQVGMFTKIPRWHKSVTVNWVAFADGYESPGDALYAAKAMRTATEEWNALDFGVQFQQVDALEDANFALGYGGQPASRDGVLAEAYFPSVDDISDVIVYKLQFSPDLKHEMHNTFLHELGHVLGLRHEHAEWDDPDFFEGGSTTIGSTNRKSVMAYDPEGPPMIRDSDVEGIRKFYDLREGQVLGGMRVKLFTPDN